MEHLYFLNTLRRCYKEEKNLIEDNHFLEYFKGPDGGDEKNRRKISNGIIKNVGSRHCHLQRREKKNPLETLINRIRLTSERNFTKKATLHKVLKMGSIPCPENFWTEGGLYG